MSNKSDNNAKAPAAKAPKVLMSEDGVVRKFIPGDANDPARNDGKWLASVEAGQAEAEAAATARAEIAAAEANEAKQIAKARAEEARVAKEAAEIAAAEEKLLKERQVALENERAAEEV
jgi:hypothetical protein